MNNTLTIVKDKVKWSIREIYSPLRFFIIFCVIAVLQSFIRDEFIITDDVFYRSYAERYTYYKIQSFAEIISTVEWVIYVLTPLAYLIKFTIITSILLIGDLLLDYKIGFRKLFQVTMIAETVFLIPDFIKIIWFLAFEQAETINQVGSFEILSIYSLFNEGEIYNWLRYPFSVANLYELTYWLFMALGIKYITRFDYNKSLKFVLSTYVIALLLWVTFVMFLSIM